MSELGGQAEALETPARIAEAQVWQELVATSRPSAEKVDCLSSAVWLKR
jgi:hypothetical protein